MGGACIACPGVGAVQIVAGAAQEGQQSEAAG